MSREERIELMTSVVTKLDEAAMLLTQAEEAVFADQVDDLADRIATTAIRSVFRSWRLLWPTRRLSLAWRCQAPRFATPRPTGVR